METSHSTKPSETVCARRPSLVSSVKHFFDVTTALIELLETEIVDRDEKIAGIEELLEKRESLMLSIKPPFSEDEVQYGKQLASLNQKLTRLLEEEKAAIQKDINHLKKQKQSVERYINPYESLITDGAFYDKRK